MKLSTTGRVYWSSAGTGELYFRFFAVDDSNLVGCHVGPCLVGAEKVLMKTFCNFTTN